jgi:prepilin-type N-terminal cleavage/methylation domain-containing protein
MTIPATTSRRGRGFTLVEAIASIVIIGIVGLVASRLVVTASAAIEGTARRAELSGMLNAAMERAMIELRNIDAAAGVPVITSPSTSSISFTVGGSSRQLSHSGTTVSLTGAAASGAALATDVTTFTLTYYDRDNATIASPAASISSIRSIQLTMTATRGGVSETLRSRVFIRSLSSGSGAS